MGPKIKNEDIRKEEVIQAVIIDDSLNPEFLLDKKTNAQKLQQCLLPLANIPVLDYTLAFLSTVGVEETILFCTTKADKIHEHIRQSKWNSPGFMAVKVIVSERCHSMGDVMRELDSTNAIQGDFILMYADTVSNAKLMPILKKHRAITLKDKGAVMTMVYSKAGPQSSTRALDKETLLALDKRNGRILSHQKISRRDEKISLPLELFLDRPCVEVCYDLLDPCISICSAAVPPLFSDNFDYQTRDDLVKGLLLNEDILGNTMYAHCLDGEYAARIPSLAMLHAVRYIGHGVCRGWGYDTVKLYMHDLCCSIDVIHRWSYPLVPDAAFVPSKDRYTYLHAKSVYKQPNVSIGKSEIEDSVIGSGSKIGKSCKILSCVIGKNCKIGDNVNLEHCLIWDNSTIESNFSGKYLLVPVNAQVKSSSKNVITFNPCVTKVCQTRDGEDGGSDTDSSDDDLNDNAQHVDEYEVFFSEVLDSLVRGFKEKVELDALCIEINASRFANNIPANEVNHWVLRAILNIPDQTGEPLGKVLTFFVPILKKYFSKSSNDQHQCLTAIEHEGLSGVLPAFSKVLLFLYTKDILEEEAIISWHNEDASEDIKKQKQLQDFIVWLQNAEEESDDSSD